MGGGGAMRTAVKAAGITLGNVGLRGLTPENYPISAVARMATSAPPVTSMASSAEDVNVVALSQSEVDVQRRCWELDDWEFAGGEEDLMVTAGESLPRVVFGGVPSLQEAKEATSQLSDALEKVYLSSPEPVAYDGLLIEDHHPSSLVLSDTQVLENKALVTDRSTPVSGELMHAIQAFRLLNESSRVQNVVASIVHDTKVWNAVLENQELQEFLQSHKNSNNLPDQSTLNTVDTSSDSGESTDGSKPKDVFKKIKVTVVDMLSSLSDYFRNFFEVDKASANSNGSARLNSLDTALEASFMGLAVMAIMVILIKRD
ncbi:uncharacterized protein LOC111397436 isoform X1 [Olea europaea var. sylvestris]|uniref:uncharacterized protein LOC111397436 isoform X1 n=1 Tax=Olea europaea var. sylvestris TaxID=158386 RepID=UPI000C1CE0B9|nr:uncharacterized protein LOC111397436 isoform X1 [Olea europaea var. sylvestris]